MSTFSRVKMPTAWPFFASLNSHQKGPVPCVWPKCPPESISSSLNVISWGRTHHFFGYMVPLVNYPCHVWELWRGSNSQLFGMWQGNISPYFLGWESKTLSLPGLMFKKLLLGMQTLSMPARLGIEVCLPRPAVSLCWLPGRRAVQEPSLQSLTASWLV